MKKRSRLTRARLRALLRYNKKTGEFRWRKPTGKRAPRGISADHVPGQGPIFITIDDRLYPAHQLAWFYVKGRWGRPTIDHRDGDAANNRWKNLRRATRSQNNANRRRPRHNTSGYKGASFYRRSGKWRAHIGRNGRLIYLGTFETPQAAHAAYVAAARKYFGEFARTE